MKAKNLFLGSLACLAFAACSNDDDAMVNPGGGTQSDKYVIVNIAVPGTDGTRAAGDTNESDGKTFEIGTSAENKISEALFVFFDASNKVTECQKISSFTMSDPTDNSNPQIEKLASAVLVLDEPDNIPSSVMTIINSGLEEIAIQAGTSQEDVRKKFADCYTDHISEGSFVMSNSVYKSGNTIMYATPITSENLIEKNQTDAETGDSKTETPTEKSNPSTTDVTNNADKAITIYVERALARVDVAFVDVETTTDNEAFTINATEDRTLQIKTKTDEGWGYANLTLSTTVQNVHLSYTTPMSYYVKSIPTDVETQWGTTSFAWNDASNMRSYWAESLPKDKWTEGNDWGHSSYKAGTVISSTSTVKMYCQENTLSYNREESDRYAASNTATKLVITALHTATLDGEQIAEGNFDLIKYRTEYWLKGDFLKEVSESALKNYYYKTADNQYSNDWTSKLSLTRDADATTGQYIAVPTVNTEGIDKLYGADENELTLTGSVADELKTAIEKLPDAWCWTDGKAYYYVDIEHDNKKPAVIRNHVYKVGLKSITGLGTPIFDPDVVDPTDPDDPEEPEDPDYPIIPEKPSDDAFYVLAQLNVLKWRVVSQQDVEIKW